MHSPRADGLQCALTHVVVVVVVAPCGSGTEPRDCSGDRISQAAPVDEGTDTHRCQSSQPTEPRMRPIAPPVRFARCADRSLLFAVEKWPQSEANLQEKEKEKKKREKKKAQTIFVRAPPLSGPLTTVNSSAHALVCIECPSLLPLSWARQRSRRHSSASRGAKQLADVRSCQSDTSHSGRRSHANAIAAVKCSARGTGVAGATGRGCRSRQ